MTTFFVALDHPVPPRAKAYRARSPVEPYSSRRQRLRERLPAGSAAILASPSQRQRNADIDYPYRAHSNVVYLTGFEEPETIALLLPAEHPTTFVLFVPPRDPEMELWTGRRHGVDGACERFGADVAHPIGELEDKLKEYLEKVDALYLPFEENEALMATCHRAIKGLRHRKKLPVAGPRTIGDLKLLLADMRRIKEPGELEIMRRAAAISIAGHRAAMETIAPGVPEYAVEAAINAAFRSAGANGPAYETIVGAGVNATILHYVENSSTIGENDAVLVDAGAEYRYYAGDITRTYPSSGRFSSEQRALYEIVLAAQKDALALCHVGEHVRAPHFAAQRTIIEGLKELGLLVGSTDEIIEKEGFKRFFPHGTSHYLGLDTHDAGEYYLPDGEPVPLQAGMVLTVEPGIYVAENDEEAPEAFRGIGIRIEDDIVISADGYENLTIEAPKELADIER